MPPAPKKLDAYTWMATRLLIATKSRELVPLRPNHDQRRFIGWWMAQEAHKLPVRLLVLKYRQGGFSTITEGMMFTGVFSRPNSTALVAAHDDDSSENLFRMTKRFEQELPTREKKPTVYSSRREITWSPPHNSRFMVQTAGNMNLGRSLTLQYLHCSEVAFWANARQSLLSALQAVTDAPGSAVVLESTANGVGGEFYERWQNAVKNQQQNPGTLEGFLPLFFSWLSYDAYSRKLPTGYTMALDDDEQALRGMGATMEQLYWRRCQIRDNCGGDVTLFQQEYPSTPDEAFINSGRMVFPVSITKHHHKLIEQPKRARFSFDSTCPNGVRITFGDFSSDYWEIYRTADEYHDYTVGGDVAEGQLSDRDDPKSDADYSTGFVLDRVEMSQVASYRQRLDPDLFGEQLLLAAQYYNFAWATPEANSAGMAALMVFKRKNYRRLYRRHAQDDRIDDSESGLAGWKTLSTNRNQMIDDYLAACRQDPDDGWNNKLIVRSANLVQEEETFLIDKDGKRQHRPGCHDDELFAAFIAIQLHQRCPRNRKLVGAPFRPAPRGLRDSDGVDLELANLGTEN